MANEIQTDLIGEVVQFNEWCTDLSQQLGYIRGVYETKEGRLVYIVALIPDGKLIDHAHAKMFRLLGK
jgi:hypothetical protein